MTVSCMPVYYIQYWNPIQNEPYFKEQVEVDTIALNQTSPVELRPDWVVVSLPEWGRVREPRSPLHILISSVNTG